VAAWYKHAASQGSALPDPVKDQAALSPVPQQAIENKPAPGQTGPKGMAPRTTYSRVNTGSPPVMDAGGMGQKSGPNRGMEFLPAKLAAQRGFMTTMKERPLLQELVKAAMLGTSERLSVNLEASRQARQAGVKTASAPAPALSVSGHVSTELSQKLASALGYIEQQLLKEADLMPGEGPGALQVMEATSSETNIDAGQSGQATPQNQPPQTPALQPEKAQQGNAGTGLQTNDDMMHGEQPVEPIKNASAMGKLMAVRDVAKAVPGKAKAVAHEAKDIFSGSKAREGIGKFRSARSNLAAAEKNRAPSAITNAIKGDVKEHGKAALKETAKTVGAYAGAGAAGAGGVALAKGKKKEGSVPLTLIRKLAEDAINPAQISSPQGQDPMQPPDGAAPSGEQVPSEPADVTSQKSMISSNEAAINYTKGQAKADPKKDVAQVLAEPPLSSATDKVLERAFDATGQAGVKISSAAPTVKLAASQTGAARVLLSRLLKEANDTAVGKDKKSTGMAPTTPQAATGASAATMGQ
jgi:hypothetical protein